PSTLQSQIVMSTAEVGNYQQVVQNPANRKIFIVHGSDEAAKLTAKIFVEKAGLEPVILHEQPDGGKTIIEKFEACSDVGFAIVLLTPDDLGGKASDGKDKLRQRARQNVVLELGYFMGRLQRSRVCALIKGDIEIPSDYLGVVWTKLDDEGAWKMKLVKELKAAGYEIDANRALY
ncbi:MAG: nucleotide-binding protein, partial [Rhodospirillaceae bacterium]